MIRRTVRRGLSLLEVLVAIFVMAIGMLSLLVLFPLGALSMAQAIKDNRCLVAASNARAMAISRDYRNDANVVTSMTTGLPAGYDGPSRPAYLDPVGISLSMGPLGRRIPRCTLQTLQPPAPAPPLPVAAQQTAAVRAFSLHDDLEFDTSAVPVSAANVVKRDTRFTWGYIARRPRAVDAYPVDLTVVIYRGRSLTVPTSEPIYEALGAAGDARVIIQQVPNTDADYPNSTWPPPTLKVGNWIMDLSDEQIGPGPPIRVHPDVYRNGPTRNFFYRIVGVTQAGTQVQLELQTPLQANLPPSTLVPPDPALGPAKGRIVIMTDVAEVFDKGPGWHP